MKGIYKLTNNITGDFYIGQSANLERRKKEHFSRKSHKDIKHQMYADIKHYGKEAFSFEVVSVIDDAIERLNMERELIESLNPPYNIRHTSKSHLSDEMKKHLSICGKLQWSRMTDEQKNKIVSEQLTGPKKGHIVSEETRKKLRNANLGKTLSKAVREKISISNKGKNNNQSHNKSVVALHDGNVVMAFKSVKSAGEYMHVHPSCITGVLKGRRKHCCGYEWKYFNDWSVETNCDECNSVGVILSHVEVRGSHMGEEIVRAAEMENLRVLR